MIGVNHIISRLALFALSNVVLTTLWIRFALQLAG